MKGRLLIAGVLILSVNPAFSYADPSDAAATDLNNQAVHEAQAGHFEQSVSLFRQALKMNPEDAMLQKNLSFALTDLAAKWDREGRGDGAIALLQEAVQLCAANGPAWVRLGDAAYLRENNFEKAIIAWKKAGPLAPAAQQPSIAQRIAQATRDQGIERSFGIERTENFELRFPGPEVRETALNLGRRLESEYARLSRLLGRAPPPITVILYSGKEFDKLSNRKDWAVGFYDGRIRIRLQDIDAGREPWICAHELAHAFLHKIYGSRVPIWIHEGFAQVQEPMRLRTPQEQQIEETVRSGRAWVPLKWLDNHFEQPTGAEDIDRAYAQARVVVEFLIQQYGIERFRTFIREVTTGTAIEEAFDRNFAPSRWNRVEQGNFS